MSIALAHPWVLGAAALALLTGVILVLISLWGRQVDEILTLYRPPEDDRQRIDPRMRAL
ncbi:hypothetical protein ACRAWD_05240 [Caulobacter segnis]